MVKFRETSEIDVFLIFRWLVLLSIILIAGYTADNPDRIDLIYRIAFSYFALNLGLRIFKPELLNKHITLFLIFFADILVVSSVFYLTKGISTDYYIFYFLTIMMASISSGLGASVAITVTSVGIYVWLVSQNDSISFNNPVMFLKIVFLILTAFISSVWNSVMKEKIEKVKRKGKRKKEQIKRFYQIIINSLNSGIAYYKNSGDKKEIELINPKARELVSSSDEILPLIRRYISGLNEEEAHKLIRSNDGKFWGMNRAALKNLDGEKIGKVVIFNDVTDRIKMQKEMERSKRINKLGKLTLQIAHDLRNPLGTIQGLAQMIKMNGDRQKNREYSDKILDSTGKINDFIEDMLDFSKEHDLELKQIDLRELLVEIQKEIENSRILKRKDISLQIKTNKRKYLVKGDRRKLWRAFYNLIKNACEAVDGRGRIKVRFGEEGEYIVTEIQDNGMGIPESQHDEIFEPFTTTKSNGTGLGLSIVQRIISSHRGKVYVDSKVNKGTIFTVKLPKQGGNNAKGSDSRR